MAGTNKRTYQARAKTWGLGESSTGKVQVAVEFELLSGELQGSSLTWYGYFTDATTDRTLESLRHCGWEGDDLADLRGLDKSVVELVVEDEEYEGKVRAKVQWVNRSGGLALKAPLQGDKLRAFAAEMRGRVRALDAQAGRGGAKPASSSALARTGAQPAPPREHGRPVITDTGSDNDVPF